MPKHFSKNQVQPVRYVLYPKTGTFVQFIGPEGLTWEEPTEIKSISLHGLMFTCPSDLSPHVGDLIGIEYRMGPSQTITTCAIITRIDKLSSFKNLIVLRYFPMEASHRTLLTRNLTLQRGNSFSIQGKWAHQSQPLIKSLVYLFLWIVLFCFSGLLQPLPH